MAGKNYQSFTERVVLVTNAAHGVGRAVSLQLAMAGAYVVAHYEPHDASGAYIIEQLQEIGTLGRGAAGVVTDAAGARAVVAQVEAIYGRLDALVHVVPVMPDATTETAWDETGETDWRKSCDDALGSAFFCAQAAFPLLRARPSPSISNIMPEVRGLAGHTVRAGLVGLTQHLAAILAPRVRVNGVTSTSATPADETARAACYLLSSEARHITGQILHVAKHEL